MACLPRQLVPRVHRPQLGSSAKRLPATTAHVQVTKGVDLPTWAVYIASTLTFGGGLFGIS